MLKTLGATRNVPSEALVSHELTFARLQKQWRETLTDDVNDLDIGMSELIISNVNDMNIERSFITVCEGRCTPLSDTSCNLESLHSASRVHLGPSHQQCKFSDVSGVARKNPRVRAAAMAPH